MKLSQLISFHAVLSIGFGIAFALYGPLMARLYGVVDVPSQDALLYWYVISFTRMFGAALFGLGFLLFSIRGLVDQPATPAHTRRGIVFALLMACLMGALVAVVQQSAVWSGVAGWITAAVFAILLAGYGYFLVREPGDSESQEVASRNQV